MSYHPSLGKHIAICSSDCFAVKGVLINDNQRIYEADGNCGGNVSAQLGQMALGNSTWKLVFNAVDRPCCNGQGIAFGTIQTNFTSSFVWLTQTDGSTERDPVMARLGTGSGSERYLVGWMTNNNNVYKLAIVDGSGNFIFPAEEVSSAGIHWGNRDDSFLIDIDISVDSEETAQKICDKLEAQNYDFEMFQAEETNELGICVSVAMILSGKNVGDAQTKIHSIAQEFGGSVEGWGTYGNNFDELGEEVEFDD